MEYWTCIALLEYCGARFWLQRPCCRRSDAGAMALCSAMWGTWQHWNLGSAVVEYVDADTSHPPVVPASRHTAAQIPSLGCYHCYRVHTGGMFSIWQRAKATRR